MVCSEPWVQPPISFPGQPQFQCYGTLTNVRTDELNSLGLSAEDWSEYRGAMLVIFVTVFSFLALKKALFMR